MSPSESQLRAALKQGEGDSGLDPDAIIGKAVAFRRQRQQRRVRVAGVLGVVAIVGGIGIGLAATSGGNNNTALPASSQRATASDELRNMPAAPSAPKGSAGSLTGSDYGGAVAGGGGMAPSTSGCPAKPVRYLVPGGGGTGQFGSRSPLFEQPVERLTICRYSPETNAFQSSSAIGGAEARALVTRLNASTSRPAATDCVTPVSVEILANDASGAALTPLTVIGSCQQVMVTNGTAIRFAPISELQPYLGVTSLPPVPATGTMSGSPPR